MKVAALAFLVLTAPVAAQATPWIVGPGSAADFPDIQSAIDAAASGDVVLVAPGEYEPFVVAGKSLTVVSSANNDPFVIPLSHTSAGPQNAFVTVRDIAADQYVVVQGMILGSDFFDVGGAVGIHVHSCVGPVWVQDVETNSFAQFVDFPSNMGDALLVEHCSTVTVVDCELHAGGASSASGLRVINTVVGVYGSEIVGGPGLSAGFLAGTPPLAAEAGGIGAMLTDATLLLAASELVGGEGGTGSVFSKDGTPCVPPADGGPGVRMVEDANLFRRDSAIHGGEGGVLSGFCPSTPANGGVKIELVDGTVLSNRDFPGRLQAQPISFGTVGFGDYTAHVEPGIPFLVLSSPLPLAGSFLPAKFSIQHLERPFGVNVPAVNPPTSGTVSMDDANLDLPVGLSVVTVFLQPLFMPSDKNPYLGPPSAYTVVDPSLFQSP